MPNPYFYDPMGFYSDEEVREAMGFADPGGKSALRAGDRIYPCPTCKEPNRLSKADTRLGYQCDPCADRAEGWGE